MQTFIRLAGLLALISSLAAPVAAYAGNKVSLTIVNRQTGERLTPYRHQGRLYVAGTPSDRNSPSRRLSRPAPASSPIRVASQFAWAKVDCAGAVKELEDSRRRQSWLAVWLSFRTTRMSPGISG